MVVESPGTITWPLLGVWHSVVLDLAKCEMNKRTVLDMLVAAVTLGEKTWTKLAALLGTEWEDSEVEAALKFIDRHLRCVSADGVIDVRSIETIVVACGLRKVLGTWTSAADPRVSLPLSAVIRRNWDHVKRFGNQRDHAVDIEAIFARVPIPDDQAALIRHFRSALNSTNGGTRVSVNAGLFETCLTTTGLKHIMSDPPSFIALVTTGRRKIDEGEDDPVDVHFAPRAALAATAGRRTEPPRPAGPSAEALARHKHEREEAERADAARAAAEEAQRQEKARLAAEAEAAEAERARKVAEALRAQQLEVKPVEAPAAQLVPEEPPQVEQAQPPPEPHVVSGTVELSALEIAVYEMAHAAMRLLVDEFGYSCRRMTTSLLYRIVGLVLPNSPGQSSVVERMAKKGVFTRLTPPRRAQPSVFALNTCAYTKSPYTKKQPAAVTEAAVHALIRHEYAGEEGARRLRFDAAFIVDGLSEHAQLVPIDAMSEDAEAPVAQKAAEPPPCPEVVEPEIPPPERAVQTVDGDVLAQLIDERVQRAMAAREEEIRADERSRVTKEGVRAVLRELLPEELIRLVEDAIDAVIDRRQSA